MSTKRETIRAIRLRIRELKGFLHRTDYQAIKFAEGAMTETEYYEIKQQRQAWRAEINTLEAELAAELATLRQANKAGLDNGVS